MITQGVKDYIDKSVLCWLATVDEDHAPNVSPKEIFAYFDEKTLLIANIASPGSIQNIRGNPKICVSFVDVFVQKGYKVKGTARIVDNSDPLFPGKLKFLTDLFTDAFPIKELIEITVTIVEPIRAPSYLFFPDTTESKQIESALETYNVRLGKQ
ncbi:pyridoxamine 5'-phosphate oxidase family protein [Parapedobacter sp. DT-150]|uniref:pyridoxamine 5'-phosphate oxidase family protein n=1 Tax=Parapedobacter sp. DT-150 TaxID=3396162 RepID=UPI003F1C4F5D